MIKRNLCLISVLSLFLFYGCLKSSSRMSDVIEKEEGICTYIYPVYKKVADKFDRSNKPEAYCFTTCEACPTGTSENINEVKEVYCPFRDDNTKYLKNPPSFFDDYVKADPSSIQVKIKTTTQMLKDEDFRESSNRNLESELTSDNATTVCNTINDSSSEEVGSIIKEDVLYKYGIVDEYSNDKAITIVNKDNPEIMLRAVKHNLEGITFSQASKIIEDNPGWSLPSIKVCSKLKELLYALNRIFSMKEYYDISPKMNDNKLENIFWLSDKVDNNKHYTCDVNGRESRSHDSNPLLGSVILMVKEYTREKITTYKEFKSTLSPGTAY